MYQFVCNISYTKKEKNYERIFNIYALNFYIWTNKSQLNKKYLKLACFTTYKYKIHKNIKVLQSNYLLYKKRKDQTYHQENKT